MSQVLVLQQKLQDAHAVITEVERELLKNPDSLMLRLELESLVDIRDDLQADFDELADAEWIDICKYRLFQESRNTISLNTYADSLYKFQRTFSSLYDAVRHGPRQSGHMPQDVRCATDFQFGYACAGSIGIVLMLDREGTLVDEGTSLAETIDTFFQLTKDPSQDNIQRIGRRIGPAPLRSLSEWSYLHAHHHIGTDIQWKRGEETIRVQLEYAQLQRLYDHISEVSDHTHKEITATGTLIGADVEKKTFRFKPDNGEIIHGRFQDAIGQEHEVRMPNVRYHAVLEETTEVYSSSGREKTSLNLLELTEIRT